MQHVPRCVANIRANRYTVDHVDYLIDYAWHLGSNTRELVVYVQKRRKHNEIKVTQINKFCLNE